MSAAVWPPISRELLIKEEEESLVPYFLDILCLPASLIDYLVGS